MSRAMTESERQHRAAKAMQEKIAADEAVPDHDDDGQAAADDQAERDAANDARWNGPDAGHPTVVRRQAQRAKAEQDNRVARSIAADRVGDVDPVTGQWKRATWSEDLSGPVGIEAVVSGENR
jgi:hypothetical protein